MTINTGTTLDMIRCLVCHESGCWPRHQVLLATLSENVVVSRETGKVKQRDRTWGGVKKTLLVNINGFLQELRVRSPVPPNSCRGEGVVVDDTLRDGSFSANPSHLFVPCGECSDLVVNAYTDVVLSDVGIDIMVTSPSLIQAPSLILATVLYRPRGCVAAASAFAS